MSKDTQAFDDLISARLGGYEAPYESDSWNALSQRLREIREREALFDAEAAQQIAAATRRTPAADWGALNALMRYRKRLRIHLYAAKALEAVALLMLLFPWLQLSGPSPRPAPAPPPPATKGPVAAHTPFGTNPKSSDATWTLPIAATLAPTRLDTLRVASALPPVPHIALATVGQPDEPTIYPAAPHAFARLSTLQAHPFATSDPDRTSPLTRVQGNRNQSARLCYVGATLGAGAQQFHTSERSVSTPVRTAGAVFGIKKGAWGIESGVQYAERSYDADGAYEVFQAQPGRPFLAWQMTGATLGSLSVPLRVSRRIARIGPLEARLGAGLAAHVHLQKDYEYRQVSLPEPPQKAGPIPTVAAKQHFGAGILEQGGRLRDNLFASAEIALRIEAPVGAHGTSKVFVEPAWMVGFSSASLGPETGRLSGPVMQVGVVKYL